MPPSGSSAPEPFKVITEVRGKTLVVRAFGELDLSVVEPFEDAVREALSGDAPRVLLDLSELWFIDSTGLRALVSANELATENGKELTIWGEVSPAVERAFGVSGMVDRLTFEGGPLP
jgi:anti-anti-sigma factor